MLHRTICPLRNAFKAQKFLYLARIRKVIGPAARAFRLNRRRQTGATTFGFPISSSGSPVRLAPKRPMTPPRRVSHFSPDRGRFVSVRLSDEVAGRGQERRNLPPPGNRLRRVIPVLERVLASLWRARRRPPVHPTSTVRHGRGLARLPAPRFRSAALGSLHILQWHGLIPPVCSAPYPHPRRYRRWLVRPRGHGHAPPRPFADPCRGACSGPRATPHKYG